MTPRAATLIVVLAALAWGAPPASAALHLSEVARFNEPVYVAAAPSDPHRVFVVERAGRIMVVRDGQKLETPFLNIKGSVTAPPGERGMLSMAFAPDYASSRKFYVFYTAARPGDSGGSVLTVEEFQASAGNADVADTGSRRVVFTVDHPGAANHNGGQLQFGPDHLLYASTGDGGGNNVVPTNPAQNLSSNLGKILRVDPRGSAGPTVYAYGFRNPFRFSYDRGTGDLTIADVGQSAREEVDFAPAGTPAGANYGWVCMEGTIPTPGLQPPCDPANDVPPVLEQAHPGFCAIIGGYVVRDPTLGPLTGRYVYGDNCNTELRSAVLAKPAATDDAGTGLTVGGLTSFGEDSCGHIYAASGSGSTNGIVYRIDGDAFTPCPESPVDYPTPTPPGGSPAPTPGTPDKRRPRVRMSTHRTQHPLKLRGFRIAMSCDELCGATATGSVHISGRKRALPLRRLARQLAAGRTVKVKLAAPARARRAIRSAFRRHRRVKATLKVVGRDAAGNAGRAQRTVRAKR
jgi:hypothetical protein